MGRCAKGRLGVEMQEGGSSRQRCRALVGVWGVGGGGGLSGRMGEGMGIRWSAGVWRGGLQTKEGGGALERGGRGRASSRMEEG